jgi:membrane-bound lytic murein transglycosylase D
MMIRPGSTLLVPRGAHTEQDVASRVADTGQVTLAPEIVLVKTVVRAGKGATVTNVAMKYKQTAANVAQWNGVNASATFKNKQAVILYLPRSQAPKAGPRSSKANAVAKATSAKPATTNGTSRKTRKKN